jgi:hypothetical protein
MKKKFITALLLSGLFLGSCNSALDLNPLDQIASDNYFSKKSDFENALAGVYASLQSETFSYGMPFRDCLTDNGYNQFNSGSVNEIVGGNLNPTTGGYETGIYNDAYVAIGRANRLIEKLQSYAGTDINDAEKKKMEAEARFIRAFVYFQLYSIYGEVPLVLVSLNLENQRQPKESAENILKQIRADLDFGITNLESKPYFNNGGHATASSAKALKARVLSFAAYGANGNPDLAVLKEVKDLCAEVMKEYTLSPVFENVFRDATQKNNTEIIFSVNFLAPNNTAPWDMYLGDWIAASPLQNLVDTYECKDGLPYGESPLTDRSNPFKDRDPRLSKTIFVDHPDFGGGKIHTPSNPRPTGYGVLKFLDPANLPFGFSTLSQQDAVVLRFGEVLLMYAEAQNEIAGPDQSVYDAMNTLRSRVQMPGFPAGYTKEKMRERIRHERRVELAFEGLRHYDLIRWHIAGEVLNNVKDSKVPYHFEDKFYRWPLPQTEIEKSAGVLVQNPNYK